MLNVFVYAKGGLNGFYINWIRIVSSGPPGSSYAHDKDRKQLDI